MSVFSGVFRNRVHTLTVTQRLLLPLENNAGAPTLAFGDRDTGFYESSDDELAVSIGGAARWKWSGTYFTGIISGSAALNNVASSATNPAYLFTGDADTGLGLAAANQLSLIAGGVERARFMINDTELNIVCVNDAVVCIDDAVVFI